MACKLVFAWALVLISVASAFPEPPRPGNKEGQFFTDEAIRQAQNSFLIPQGATIQKVQEGVEIAAVESIPGNQRINLFEVLGAANVPPEVVNNLQAQVDKVGRQ
ncbi:hypothetical protein J437_LFUL016793 [Ladona fulva]|uniref:Uncharacterized protein n=1 Tax=Ladona fulva TaxID=123851 RepID=A0A8K0KKG1_LADFU|nr:hypothetical protein J437_LFUL019563 [Ladona fulva]KAG8236702.1 hypothetical protein J437_LFUL016793 [Ladona fulva]